MKKTILYFLILSLITILVTCSEDKDNFLVTATLSQIAVDGGMEILEQGGSAMDAALSVALSENAVTGGKYISYAGVLNLIYFEAETGTIHNMNAAYNTVKNEKDPATIPNANYATKAERKIVNGRTILVPGFMKGVEEAHKKFGKVPFVSLFDDAIKICETGVKWTEYDAAAFKSWKNILTRYPETAAVFTKADGSYYNTGDIFKQPELAKTLKAVSQEGSDYMYAGEWGRKFVSAARKIGSEITLEDMKSYEVIWSEPVHGNYQGYDIYTHGEPAFGGVNLMEGLNLAEISGLKKIGHYAKSPEAMKVLIQILKASYYSSYDPGYFENQFDLSLESRQKKSTSKLIWEEILKAKVIKINRGESYKNEHSAAIVAVDRQGNMVALIHSINTLNWGSNGLFVNGVSIPDAATFQQEGIEKVGPGQRLPEGTNPGIVVKDGQPMLGFSCIGSGLHHQTLTSLINVLDFNLSPKEVVNTPTVGPLYFNQDSLILLLEPNKFSKEIKTELNGLGVHFREDASINSGYWTGIYRAIESGELVGTEVWLK